MLFGGGYRSIDPLRAGRQSFRSIPVRQQFLDGEHKSGEGRLVRVLGPIAAGRHANADSLRDLCKIANKAEYQARGLGPSVVSAVPRRLVEAGTASVQVC